MADFLAAPAGPGPDGLPPRQTVERDEGHQIRLTLVRREVRVSCRCLALVSGGFAWSKPSLTDDDHWALYNGLPHRATAGVFEPVDEATGAAEAG